MTFKILFNATYINKKQHFQLEIISHYYYFLFIFCLNKNI